MKDFNKLFSGKPVKRSKERKPKTHEPSETAAGSSEQRVVLQVKNDFFLEIAMAAWKLRQKITDPVTHEPRDEMRSLIRHVDALWDALSGVGLEIQDHTEQPFDSGQSLDVLAFQPTLGVTREIVSETVKPTIYLKGQRLQVGQVIVAAPQETE